MGIPTVTRLNGKVFTRNSCAIRVNGIYRLTGVESMEWSDELPFELVSGMNDGGVPMGKAQGNYGCAGSISLWADEAPAFETALLLTSPLAANNIAAVTFQLAVTMREDVRTRIVVLVNCNISGRPSRTVSNDGSALVAQYQLQPTLVLEDGKSLVNLVPAF